MDDSERDELLYRLDERTENMDSNFTDIKEELSEQGAQVQQNKSRSRKNRTVLNILTGGVAVIGTVLAEQFTSMVSF